MNKQLAKKGTTLNKNMTNTEKLNLTDLTVTDLTNITDLTVTDLAECSELTLPMAAPTGNIPVSTVYYTHDSTHGSLLHIYNGTNFDIIQLL